MFKPNSKAGLFLELAQPDKYGFSRKVFVHEFKGKYKSLQMGNGGDWCRDDGSLAKRFNLQRGKKGNSIDFVRLHGFNKNPIGKPIPPKIRKAVKGLKCKILAIGKPEIDHKDGHRDDNRIGDVSKLKIDDFQPLSKAANNAKRQHCKRCRETKKRFDARVLGYSVMATRGNGVYRGSCIGCY